MDTNNIFTIMEMLNKKTKGLCVSDIKFTIIVPSKVIEIYYWANGKWHYYTAFGSIDGFISWLEDSE